MKKDVMLADYVNIANIHSGRLTQALVETVAMMPSLTPDSLPQLSSVHIAFLDMLSMRFSKLQDIMGAKIFPLTLDLLGEDALTFIDKLNKLEKLKYLHDQWDANWWMSLREIRNQLNHDYPNDYEAIFAHLSILVVKSKELLNFWKEFQSKLPRPESS